MDWWQYVLLYLGVWLMGFFTGVQHGMGVVLRKLNVAPPAAKGQTTPADLQQMLALMGHLPGGSK